MALGFTSKGDVTMMKLKQILTLLTAAGMSLVNIQPVQVTMPAVCDRDERSWCSQGDLADARRMVYVQGAR